MTMRKRNRRNFIKIGVGGAAALLAAPVTALLPELPESYVCSCGRVTYFRRPEGHFAATHFDGQRFTYTLFRLHHHLHREMAQKR